MAFSPLKSHEAVRLIARNNRVIVLGGIALVLHGFHRTTKDVDVWIEPQKDARIWAAGMKSFLGSHALTAARVDEETGEFVDIGLDEIEASVLRQRFIRVLGAERPIDAFRVPNHFDVDEFEEIWQRSIPLEDGTRLMGEVDLIVTKLETGRPHDEADIRFLQSKVENAYRQRLRTCSVTEAAELFERFSTPDLAQFAALMALDRSVRDFGIRTLVEMARNGDPYAAQLAKEVQLRQQKQEDERSDA
jgi:hypothetical protein